MTTGPDLPPSLDWGFLARQTFGDLDLQADLLRLFERQCACLPGLLAGGEGPYSASEAAHALTGAARAIGAARIADIAARLEAEIAAGAPARDVEPLRLALDSAVDDARRVIGERLAAA